MNILITGGRGYLGGRLCQFLNSSEDYQVFRGGRVSGHSRVNHTLDVSRLVRGIQGSRPGIRFLDPADKPRDVGRSSLPGDCDKLRGRDNKLDIQDRVMDWSSRDSLLACCSDIDVIVHLAGMNAADCSKNPAAALENREVGTARLLEAAQTVGVRRFIYISTTHVYGSPLIGHITEETSLAPIHPYAISHQAAETQVLMAHKTGEIEGFILRLSNAFGAPAQLDVNCWDLLFNDLCRQAVMQKKITLQTSGMQRRDFVPITDVCHAIKHICTLPITRVAKTIFNMGGSWSPTILEAATLVADRFELTLGYRPPIIRTIDGVDEISPHLYYSINSLRNTGFSSEADRLIELDELIYFCRNFFVQ